MTKNLKYVIGDATNPNPESDLRLIIHCCNDIGGWGRGFVLALSRRNRDPEKFYRLWFDTGIMNRVEFKLGNIQVTPYTDENVCVVNMIGQHGIKTVDGVPPVRYEAIASCLSKVAGWVKDKRKEGKTVTVHAPRFGSALAGGEWSKIESLIIENLCNEGIEVTIYDLPESK